MSNLYNEIVRGVEYRRKIAVIDKIPGAENLYNEQLDQASSANSIGDYETLRKIIYWFNTHPL